MSPREYRKTQDASPSDTNPVSQDVLRKLNIERLIQTEISAINYRLDKILDFKRDPSAEVNPYVDGLVKRRANLLKQIRLPTSVKPEITAQLSDSVVTSIGHFFTPWQTLNLPYMSEGINEKPSVEGAGGEIETKVLLPGRLQYYGAQYDNGIVNPHTEKWWVHNWTCSVVFPPAPFKSRLYYRFTVDAECRIYLATVENGLLAQFITLGKTADANSSNPNDSPFATDNLEDSGWPLFHSMPPDISFFSFSTSIPQSGSIEVQAGQSAALGFIYGAITGLASGSVTYSSSRFDTRLTLPAGTQTSPEALGKIEYRFEPIWWLDSIDERMKLTLD